ncbi:SAV_6107 family HEPN domain-containing protein [Gordonia sp. SL306]|uniref:SAV_6107 family HEPN domain-containing protein n=1 Tax=Gordonia sp. SL306 TaxID=2995145 RepID=UPI0022700F8D|nr:SAV_6107 family HEPN domain-containing protein [Gordonia sp. SL306]WAC55858.1 SAV_6107 family HEPN domain-containing protein [Gordonia sp. SL306]
MPNSIPTTGSTTDIDPIVVGRSRDLLDRAQNLFDNADGVDDSAERFRQYYLTALRAAGAALEIHEPTNRPVRRRHSRSAWNRVPVVVPELDDHAAYFAARSRIRLDIEAGLVRSIDDRAVQQMRRRVIDLLDAVEALLISYEQGKLPHQAAHSDRTA